jgi:anti-anti-sigma regulatory factor
MKKSERAADTRRTIVFSDMNVVDMLDRAAMKELRENVIAGIASSKPGTILCLDLCDIKWINSSAVDEVIGKALEYLKESGQEVFLFLQTEINTYEHVFNISRALRDAELPLMVRVKVEGDSYSAETVGPLQRYLAAILRLAYSAKLPSVTSAEVAAALDLTKSKSSTYLTKLFEMRLLKREKTVKQNGFEYIYLPLFN